MISLNQKIRLRKNITLLMMLAAGLLIFSCKRSNLEKLEQLRDIDYSEFEGYSFFIRGKSKDSVIIFSSKNSDSLNTGYLIIYANEDNGKVLKTQKHLMEDTSLLQVNDVSHLIPTFLSYKIFHLGVSTDGSVFIKTGGNDMPDLVKMTKNYTGENYYKTFNKSGEWLYSQDL